MTFVYTSIVWRRADWTSFVIESASSGWCIVSFIPHFTIATQVYPSHNLKFGGLWLILILMYKSDLYLYLYGMYKSDVNFEIYSWNLKFTHVEWRHGTDQRNSDQFMHDLESKFNTMSMEKTCHVMNLCTRSVSSLKVRIYSCY